MIEPNKHYSLRELADDNTFPGITGDTVKYIRFIGTQATRGNFLARDPKATKMNGEHPFKGSDVIAFINNIK
jgi:hypothetical protein